MANKIHFSGFAELFNTYYITKVVVVYIENFTYTIALKKDRGWSILFNGIKTRRDAIRKIKNLYTLDHKIFINYYRQAYELWTLK